MTQNGHCQAARGCSKLRHYRGALRQFDIDGMAPIGVASVLHDPRFVHTADVQQNLLRAIAVTQAEDRHYQQQVAQFSSTIPGFQELRNVMATIVEKGYADNLLDAYTIARNHQASVQKAQRAAKVKTSSGYNAKGSGGSTLDSAISKALENWSE
jgi:D-alanyl-D-alanine dipeptidase